MQGKIKYGPAAEIAPATHFTYDSDEVPFTSDIISHAGEDLRWFGNNESPFTIHIESNPIAALEDEDP